MMSGCSKSEDSASEPAVEPLAPPPEGEGFQLSMETVAPAYSEVWKCEVYPLPTTQTENVNWAEYQQNSGTHHMTLSSTLGGAVIDAGSYECEDLYGDSSLMQDQIMFFGTQGEAEGVMRLPEGVAATFPTNINIIHEVHYVNTTDQDVDIYSRVNAWTIPSEEVVEGIWGGQVRDENIEIPANSEHTEWSRCVMNEDIEVLFLASHTHELGIEFNIAPFDGKDVGEVFYTNNDWHDPKIVQYDPPMAIKAGEGFEWSCTWRNDSDEPVSYGSTSQDEMCNLAIVHMPFSVTASCDVVETSDGVLWKP